ncbi:MAG: hypothetical protein CMQ07_04570 [Gammaproteobacteria bacterium]|nr:hypothetical protein [Gammaproteobacteria bacterium]
MFVWFIATTEDLRFYLACRARTGREFYLIHLNLLTFVAAKWYRAGPGTLVWAREVSSCTDDIIVENAPPRSVSKCFNVLAGRLSIPDAAKAYECTVALLSRLNAKQPIKKIVIPSGRHIHHWAATTFSRNNDIANIFINYGNFPGRTFFDPLGTDSQSSVFRDGVNPPASFTTADAKKIIEQTLQQKHSQKSIPQRTSFFSEAMKSIAFKLSIFFEKVLGVCGDRQVANIPSPPTVAGADINDTDALQNLGAYFFFPLQVSTDVQVVGNYEGGSIEAGLEEACRIANESDVYLVLKLHPAEKNPRNVDDKINVLRASCKIVTANLPVEALVMGAEQVITINSTVGLEAKLLSRRTTFLGRSMYAPMDDRQMAWYLDKILLKVDYHSGFGAEQEFVRVRQLLA